MGDRPPGAPGARALVDATLRRTPPARPGRERRRLQLPQGTGKVVQLNGKPAVPSERRLKIMRKPQGGPPLCDKARQPTARETTMKQTFRAFAGDESGATAIEYGLIARRNNHVIITAVKGIGTRLDSTFSSISTQLK